MQTAYSVHRTQGWVRRILLYGLSGMALTALLAWALIAYKGIRTIEDLILKNEKLQSAITELTAEAQIGYAKVLERRVEDGRVVQRIQFVETAWDDPEETVLVREYEIPGEEIYFDALIVKFDSQLVQDGRERSLYLWRRIYSDTVAPQAGFPLEVAGSEPERYRDWLAKLPIRHRKLFWSEIWELAHDRKRLKSIGVRAIYGNAIYHRMEPGKVYRFKINNSGLIYPVVENDL